MTTKRCLRDKNNDNKNLPYKKEQYKTYGKIHKDNIDKNSNNTLLENNLWLDSFDRLLNCGSKFSAKSNSKKFLRVSYNRNSSYDLSGKENISDLKSCKIEKKKLKNNLDKNDDSSPFNLEKSLAAIKCKLRKKVVQKPKKKCQIRSNQNKKLVNTNEVASTPMHKKKLKNLFDTCVISPIKPEWKKKQMLDSSINVYDKIILNYTDSIEEARNLSTTKLYNVYSGLDDQISKNYNNKSDIVKPNQAGLENNNSKRKYILSYVNKLPSLYEKYDFMDESFTNQNLVLSKQLNYNKSDIELQNDEISGSDIFESYKVPEFNKTQELQIEHINAQKSFSVEIVNNSNSDHYSSNDPQTATSFRGKIDICLNNTGNGLTQKLPVINSTKIKVTRDNNNKSNFSNYLDDQSIHNINSMHITGDSLNVIGGNFNNKSLSNFIDFLFPSQLLNKSKSNSAFAKKLIFLQNCQIINDSIRLSKNLNSNNNNKAIRGHSFEPYKKKESLNLDLKKRSDEYIKHSSNLDSSTEFIQNCEQRITNSISEKNLQLTIPEKNNSPDKIEYPILCNSLETYENNPITEDVPKTTDTIIKMRPRNFVGNRKRNAKHLLENISNDCEIVTGTPLVQLKRSRRLRNIVHAQTKHSKEINQNLIENSINLNEQLVSKSNNKRTKTFKLNPNFTIEDDIINTNIKTNDMKLKLTENRKRIQSSLLNNGKCKSEKQKVSFGVVHTKVNMKQQKDKFKIKKCKVILKNILPKISPKLKIIEDKPQLRKCKILLKRIKLMDKTKKREKSKVQFLNNNLNISTVDLTKDNSKTSIISLTNFENCYTTHQKTTHSFPTECSIIEISFGKDQIDNNKINKKSSLKRKTVKFINLIKSDEKSFNENDDEITNNIFKLPSGKWRRTLNNWKKNKSIINLDESQISVVLDKNTTISLEKNTSKIKYKLMPKIVSSYKQNTIISDQLIDKELKTNILPGEPVINNDGQSCINSLLNYNIPEKLEAESKIIEKRQTGVRKTLLLEPTDDGTPNYTTSSLFSTFAKSKAAEAEFFSIRQPSKNSKRFIEIEEDFNDLQDVLQQKQPNQQQQQQQQHHHREEYSDETRCNNTITNNKKFQHQISVPICGTKQQQQQTTNQRSTRRGRSSIIETTNSIGFEQLSSSPFTGSGDYHHHHHQSNREFIHSLLLNEDEQNLLLCPSLNVSIRALLSPRDIVLRRCGQTDPYDFSIIYSESELRQCRKIGEGVYGEVYMNKNRNGEAVVLKIIPIDGQIEINGEQQKNFEQILPEIIIAAELSRLRNDSNFMTSGFVEVKHVHCVQGRYPQHLIDLWELYRDNCGTENDHPEIFQDDQLYIVLELANGGQDLEAFQFQNALQSYSAFLQTALSLAVAERKFKFEHRDLHWGNILLAATDDKEIKFKFNDKIISIPTHGVKATIIDYTLSRMNFEGCCLYNDLSNDNELFAASGDYQFDIYRSMKKNLKNQWERYDPYTNILWLHYTIDKMISGARYRSSKTKKHRSAIQDMMQLRDELLDYKSASDYVECLD